MKKIIWSYWHQGLGDAPSVVKKCVNRCKLLHPTWIIYILDRHNIYNFIDPIPIQKWDKLQMPHQSDLLRTQLLIKYGGVWMDPTVYCMYPLDNWLPSQMKAGLFFFQNPGKDRIISNWFIAAERDNYLLKQLYNSLLEYWNTNDFRNLNRKDHKWAYYANRLINGRSLILSQLWLTWLFKKVIRIYPYMIYHFMFYHLIRTNNNCNSTFLNMPTYEVDGPVMIKRLGFNIEFDSVAHLLRGKNIPLFKLDWKTPLSEFKQESLIIKLLDNKI